MKSRWLVLITLLLVPIAFFAGRMLARGPARIPLELEAPQGPFVATFGKSGVTVKEFQTRLDALPAADRVRFSSPEGKRKLLQLVLRTELLAQEAARAGFDRDPAILHAAKQAMVDRFLSHELDEKEIASGLTEEQLRKYYQEHLSEFRRPAMAEASVIFVSAPPEGSERRRKQEHAQALLESLQKAVPQSPRTFESLAQAKSEDPVSRPSGGATGRVSQEDLAKRWGDALAQAIFTLSTPNSLTPVIEVPGGFAVAKLSYLVPGIDEPFEKSKDRIRALLSARERLRRVEERVVKAGQAQGLVVHEDALAGVR